MTKNFPKLSDTKRKIQETKTPRRIMLKHTIFKHQKIKDKEKIFKEARRGNTSPTVEQR